MTLVTPEREILPRAVALGPNVVLTDNQPAFQAARPTVPRTSPRSTAKKKPIMVRSQHPNGWLPSLSTLRHLHGTQCNASCSHHPCLRKGKQQATQGSNSSTTPIAQAQRGPHNSKRGRPPWHPNPGQRMTNHVLEWLQRPEDQPTPARTVPRPSSLQGPAAARRPRVGSGMKNHQPSKPKIPRAE